MQSHADRSLTGAGRAAASLLAALAALLLLAAPVHAAPPPNDGFSAAETISGESGEVRGDNTDATEEPGEPEHGGPGGASVWYSWTAPFTGHVAFDTCTGRSFDTMLAIYTGSTLSGLRQLAANDDACDYGSRVTAAVTEGTVYFVAVDGFEGETGRFTLQWRRVTPPAAPANDAFASARVVSGVRGRVLGTTVGATGEAGEPRSLGESSVWYRWRAPRTMPVVFSTCGAQFDTLLGVYRGSAVNRLSVLAWNDDACGLSSRVTLRVQGGQVYHVGVGALGDPGPFQLRWEPAPCRVPNLRGQMLARARVLLARSGCRLGFVRYVPSTIAPRGAVVDQWPAPGRVLPHLARVRVAVSSGSPR